MSDIDLRLKQLSYSSALLLHECPRKYQLYKLRGKEELDDEENSIKSITFTFGHVVGEGVQLIFQGKSIEEIIWAMFLRWDCDLAATNDKQLKSFYYAVHAVTSLYESIRVAGFLSEYELVYVDDKPATELSFAITSPDGFRFRGFVDAVLRNTLTGEITVLEVKTTSAASINPAQYKNSSQALGYSVVLDNLFPDISSYKVLYLPYKAKAMEWEVLPFAKTLLQRAQWIQQLILDIELIKMYEGLQIYPMYGESCYNYYSPCEYFGICNMNTQFLIKELSNKHIEQINSETFTVNLTLQDLIATQMEK